MKKKSLITIACIVGVGACIWVAWSERKKEKEKIFKQEVELIVDTKLAVKKVVYDAEFDLYGPSVDSIPGRDAFVVKGEFFSKSQGSILFKYEGWLSKGLYIYSLDSLVIINKKSGSRDVYTRY